MEYDESRPIYLQVADYCLRCIGTGEWPPGERIPSTKELAMRLAVNNRTIIKAYEELEAVGLIYVLRGQGYFCHKDAPELLLQRRRAQFENEVIPNFLATMRDAGLTIDETIALLKKNH